jgi:transcriptional regulator with PAS, ATPase and Fis domain
MTIGFSGENNLSIKNNKLSNQHVKIEVKNDSILINDLNSAKGTYVKGKKIKQACIGMGESFCIGGMEFILKMGSLEEFQPERELLPYFDMIHQDNEQPQTSNINYRYEHETDPYEESVKQILKMGMKMDSLNNFIMGLSGFINTLPDFGSLIIISRQGMGVNILLSVRSNNQEFQTISQLIKSGQEIFQDDRFYQPIPNRSEQQGHFYLYRLNLRRENAALFYFPRSFPKFNQEEKRKIKKFLMVLSRLISFLSHINSETLKKKDYPSMGCQYLVEIITANEYMRELIGNAKKIAQSDIYVLLQGESGTGKELFARYIHCYSPRCANDYVAINCAAIPGELLEAEMFGYEKGAFTSAYSQKKGKLEIASGGTLVLDEVSEMPIHLQSKLLRALQENEFYRLGGTVPIKVNLRIISITNQDLKQLVKAGKFRQDLYYRLVHRTIVIPPLRERIEDISRLIHHFTQKYCMKDHKVLKGYSLKAYEALLFYQWPGNVRQLENEIKAIVNLTENQENISYDLLSDEIKSAYDDYFKTKRNSPLPDGEGEKKEQKGVINTRKEAEIHNILNLLEKNKWSKTQTAKELNMTYRGLHKKMKRLGIERRSK